LGPEIEFVCIISTNKNVIHVNVDIPRVEGFMENGVDHSLKSSRRVTKTEKHDCGFVETTICDKGSFLLISILDTNIVKTPANINDRKDSRGLQLRVLENFGEEGERVAISNSVSVEFSIVHDGAKTRILTRCIDFFNFRGKEEGGSLWAVRNTYMASREIVVKEEIELFLFLWREMINLATTGNIIRDEIDAMIKGSVFGEGVETFSSEDFFIFRPIL
jgi:hypothetical protein